MRISLVVQFTTININILGESLAYQVITLQFSFNIFLGESIMTNTINVCSLNEVSEIASIAGSKEFDSLVKSSLVVGQKAIQTKKAYYLVSASNVRSQDNKLAYVVHSMDMFGSIKPQLDKRRFPTIERAYQVAQALALGSIG